MHGLIHVVVKDLIVSRFGEDAWGSVLQELDVADDAAVLELKQYDDAITVATVNAVVKVLGIIWDDALRAAGAHFVAYVYVGGHLRMLESMGDNVKEFTRNLNHMHLNLVERMMRGTRPPCFHISDEEEGGFRLSYASVRGSALVAMVEGILPAVSELLHRQAVGMQLETEPLPGFSATWRIRLGPIDRAAEPPPVADRRGAVSLGAAWHHALVSLFGSCTGLVGGCADVEAVPAAPSSDCAPEHSKHRAPDAAAPGHPVQSSGAPSSRLDELACKVKSAAQPAELLMRSVPSHRLSASWMDGVCLLQAEEFWRTNEGDMSHFQMASPAASAARFISHAWSAPGTWHEVMGSKCSYAALKSTELHLAATEIGADEDCKLEDITFWVDKCCIPQEHSLKEVCISMVEDFLDRCEGMVVLLNWEYFQRLWCVYEWATFLVRHPLENVTICLESFLRPSSRQLYIAAIRNLTVGSCKCSHEPDRQVLKQKVAQYYTSEASFEELVRCSAIALIVRALCRGGSRGLHAWEDEVVPFVQLARELRLDDLAEALESAEPSEWRRNALEAARVGTSAVFEVTGWQPHFNYSIDVWFLDRIAPVLKRTKAAAVRRDFAAVSHQHENLVEKSVTRARSRGERSSWSS